MTNHDNADKLISFLNSAHSVFHAVDRISRELDEAGFCALRESEAFRLEPGRSYYVKRNNSSLIAFRLSRQRFTSARLIRAHTDCPVL